MLRIKMQKSKTRIEEETFDSHDHYGDPDVPRSDDLYKRCEHGLIMSECATCELEDED